jgi:hypothetical protein
MKKILYTFGAVAILALSGCDPKFDPQISDSQTNRGFAPVTQLANGGAAYFDGRLWWYYQVDFESLGGAIYSPDSDAWEPCVQSPAECSLEVNKMARSRSVRIDKRAMPTGAVISMEEASRLIKLIENSHQRTNVPAPDAAEPHSTT